MDVTQGIWQVERFVGHYQCWFMIFCSILMMGGLWGLCGGVFLYSEYPSKRLIRVFLIIVSVAVLIAIPVFAPVLWRALWPE